MKARYQPVEDGYQIVGSRELFNRTLYGGHEQDELPERYFTFGGDSPVIMGAVTDWRSRPDCTHAKCGVLMTGVAMTPGLHIPDYYYFDEKDGDRTSQWFHWSGSTITTFRNGWMEYEVRPNSVSFPQIKAQMRVLPLQSHSGFLVRLRVRTDQHVHLVFGFGGVTDFLGSLDQPMTRARNFRPQDCIGNTVQIGGSRAKLSGRADLAVRTEMWIGTTFATEVSVGDAAHVEDGPGAFKGREHQAGEHPMVRMSCAVLPGQTLEGSVVVLRNAPEAVLDEWLGRADAAKVIEQEIVSKRSAIQISTPDPLLDLTVAPSVLAMDACWHERTFHHGSFNWHAPYMGWRHWYGPTVIGWHDRVARAARTYAAMQVMEPDAPKEEVSWEGGQYSTLRGSYGFIPEIPDGRRTIFYNCQEVYLDHILHYLEWTGDLELAGELFDVLSRVLEWEKRILDPDDDGLYQSWLNTWVSDAHSYNGGGCAQSSAYNFRANRTMAELAKLLGREPGVFEARAQQTRRACQEVLWQREAGVMAEYVDTVGNKLVHPSPELATVYHSIDARLVDEFQAYQMLRFTEATLRNERTDPRGGRLVWSSLWYPQNYSSCGLYTAENLHLAWAYFMCGYPEKGIDILNAVVDAHFVSQFPGGVGHVMLGSGHTFGSIDFSEIMSLHLRVIVEGLFGIRPDLLHGRIEVAPNFPRDWTRGEMRLRDYQLIYQRAGAEETLTLRTPPAPQRTVRLPMRATTVEQVELNGRRAEYRLEPRIGRCDLLVDLPAGEEIRLVVRHGEGPAPTASSIPEACVGEELTLALDHGSIVGWSDPSAALGGVDQGESAVRGRAAGAGHHSLFIRAREEQWEGWLAADVEVKPAASTKPTKTLKADASRFEPVDISRQFNCSLTEIHNQKYAEPRPKGYSIMTTQNGRFGWDWNQGGFCATKVYDSRLRSAGGRFVVPSGVAFATPEAGPNVACVSVWENFPSVMTIPLSGRGSELAVFFVGITNPMQSQVENARLSVRYADGESEPMRLVPTLNFDDWLNGALQQEHETAYFSDFNHGIVARLPLEAGRELKGLRCEVLANEVIVGVLGVSIQRG